MKDYIRKRWLKRKGCKNVALVDYQHYDEDGETYVKTVIEPYYKGQEFRYLSKPYKGQISELKNIYIDRRGRVVFVHTSK